MEGNRKFSKILTKIEIFEILDRNRNFSKILTEIDIFEIWDKIRKFLKIFIEISRFSIFFFLSKSQVFKNFERNLNF